MTIARQPSRRRRLLTTIAALALVASGCGDDDSGDETAPGDDGAAAPAPECPGDPIKLTTITALTGPRVVQGPRLEVGTEAAVQAINAECALGRPLEVEVCDDAGDVNENLACGRDAKTEGSLALITNLGSFEDGAGASELPGIYLNGTGPYELTDANAYSSASGIILAMSSTTAAKARGAEDYLMVLPDTPAFQFASTQIALLADIVGVDYDSLFYPADTTDFAPLAAQIASREPDAVAMAPSDPVPVVNALAAEGITPEDHVVCFPATFLDPEDVEELGAALDGACAVSQVLPPTATDNEGIAQFREDVEAAGHDPDSDDVDFNSVLAWSNLNKLVEALEALDPAALESLDSPSLVDAVVATPVQRPEAAPYDFNAHQFPEFESLGAFRLFTRQVAILELDDGNFDVLTDGFVDVAEPPDLG